MATTKKAGKITKQINEDINTLSIHLNDTDGTEVEVRLGMTIQMKQYEMARCDVSIRLPGKKNEVDNLVKEAHRTAKKHLKEILKPLREKVVPSV